MNYPTSITWGGDGKGSVDVSHINHIIRYFNGRRYHTVQNRVSYHIPACGHIRELNWTQVHLYTSVAGRKMSYRESPSAQFAASPVDEIRAMLIMVPGDMQEVPF